MNAVQDWILEVTDLNEYVRRSLAADPMLRSLRLRGEISNFKRHTTGHWYFTLKDEHSRINCVMFRQNAMRMSLRPVDGMRVILSGSVSLYAEGGAYQFYAEAIRPDGLGELYQQFEALKARLAAEGLFAEGRKRPLPLRPKKIAVVTSPTGAVLQDIRRVAGRRDPSVPLLLLPVQVQGAGAAEEIARAIRKAGTLPDVDVVITGRGGGSMEDLWAFNEEIVARAIAESPVPVVSAVGHETDFTIADFVADVRASTPSNAAEIAVPSAEELREGLRLIRRQLDQQLTAAVNRRKMQLLACQRRLEGVRPDHQLARLKTRTAQAMARLNHAMDSGLMRLSPRLAMAGIRMDQAMDRLMLQRRERMNAMSAHLAALNPARVLDRGYALVTDGERVIPDAASATDNMTLHFRDGQVRVRKEEEQHGGQEKNDF